MSAAYVETSWLVAILFGEPGWERMAEELESADQLYSSNLLEAELRSTLAREDVELDAGSVSAIRWVLPDRPLTDEIGTVLAAGHLRGADLWHLATALFLSGPTRELSFLSLDRQQSAVADRLGFGPEAQGPR